MCCYTSLKKNLLTTKVTFKLRYKIVVMNHARFFPPLGAHAKHVLPTAMALLSMHLVALSHTSRA